MAPNKWTAERDQKLLLLIIDLIKLNYDDISRSWEQKFADEDFKPTSKAISEHVAALKRKNEASTKDSGAAGTPRQPTSTVKTAPSTTKHKNAKKVMPSNKRARLQNMSDEDDSEDGMMPDLKDIIKRETPSRRSIVNRRAYIELSSGVDSEAEPDSKIGKSKNLFGLPSNAKRASVVDSANGEDRDEEITTGVRKSIARSKKDPPKLSYLASLADDYDNDEDSDEFMPFS